MACIGASSRFNCSFQRSLCSPDLTPGITPSDQIVADGDVVSCRFLAHPSLMEMSKIGEEVFRAIAYDPAKCLSTKIIQRPCSRAPVLEISLTMTKTGKTKARSSLIFVLPHKYLHLQALRLGEFITEHTITGRPLISRKGHPLLPIALQWFTKLLIKETCSPSTASRGIYVFVEKSNEFLNLSLGPRNF